MEDVELIIEKGLSVVKCRGAMVIDSAAGVCQVMRDALNSGLSVHLDMGGVTECDITFVQMVASLCRSLNANGRSLGFVDGLKAPAFEEALRVLGFCGGIECSCNLCIPCPLSSPTVPMESRT